MYKIENLQVDDREEIELLYACSLKNNPDGFIQDISYHGNIYDRFVSYANGGGVVRILKNEVDQKPIGMVALRAYDAKKAELCKLHLNQNFQGQGLGTMLLTDLLESAKQQGFEQIDLHVTVTQKPAIALYQKFGFVVSEQKECLVNVKNKVESYDTLFMYKDL